MGQQSWKADDFGDMKCIITDSQTFAHTYFFFLFNLNQILVISINFCMKCIIMLVFSYSVNILFSY